MPGATAHHWRAGWQSRARMSDVDIKAEEISKIIREQIGSYAVDVDVAEVGSIISIGDGIARVHGVENGDGRRDARVPARRVRHRAEPRRGERRRGAPRRVQGDQGRRHRQAHRPHHLGAGRRRAARPRGQRARPADRRQGSDCDQAVLADRASGARRRRSPDA